MEQRITLALPAGEQVIKAVIYAGLLNASGSITKKCIDLRGGAEWNNIPFSEEILALYKSAWDKLSLATIEGQILEKPVFENVIIRFTAFTAPFKYNTAATVWDKNRGVWLSEHI